MTDAETSGKKTRRVWGLGTPRSFRVHWMLAELGLPYETREILPRHPSMNNSEFRALSLREKIPLYEGDGIVMGESGAIVMWLAEAHLDRQALIPPSASPARAACFELCFFALNELDSPLYTLRLHGGLPEVYGEAPAAVSAAQGYFIRMVSEIERRLKDGRPHLLGDRFTIADLLVVTCLNWADRIQLPLVDSVRGYSERLSERPAFRSAIRTNYPPQAIKHMAGHTGAQSESGLQRD